MAVFVLIHGAFHGGWCFEKIVPLLKAKGHTVLAPDLAGLGDDPTPLSKVTFEGWCRDVAALCEAQSEPVILAGHSRGGIVISQAAEYARPGAIRLLVYLTAGLARDGETMIEAAYGPGAEVPLSLNDTEDGFGHDIDPTNAVAGFYHMVDPAEAQAAVARLRPEPNFSTRVRMRLSESRYGQVPRAYIECLRDQALSIDVQRRMQAASPCVRVITIDSDHSPFYSAPKELTEALDSLA